MQPAGRVWSFGITRISREGCCHLDRIEIFNVSIILISRGADHAHFN